MDRLLNRINEAAMAADRIINMVECAGFDVTDPTSIINSWDYCSMPDGMQYAYGASRLVIWDEDYCDYVIKIALSENYEKYCHHEVEVYEAAVKEGLADNFAWCMCYAEPIYDDDGEYDAPGIYVMEYVDCNEDEVADTTYKHGYEEYCESHGLDSSNWDSIDEYDRWYEGDSEDRVLDYMESLMPSEYKRMFEVFMCKWWITDIHEQNVALRPDGSMVIVDYAGWNW